MINLGLDLNTWRKKFGMHPYHFFGLSNNLVPISDGCPSLVREFSWQFANAAGRADVERAIAEVEEQFATYIGAWPYPKTITEVLNVGGANRNLKLSYGKLISLGQPVATTVSTNAVDYTDDDGDGVIDTATMYATVPTGTLAFELSALTTIAEGRVVRPRPRSIELSSSTVAKFVYDAPTLVKTLFRDRAVSPNSGWNPNTVPPDTASPYNTQLTVIRTVITNSSTVPSATDVETGERVEISIRDSNLGYVSLDGWNTYSPGVGVGWCLPHWPRQLSISYLSGTALNSVGQYNDELATVIARFAASRVARKVCSCDTANAELYDWQKDLAITGATDELFAVPDDVNNPFGSRRGAIQAWRYADDRSLSVGVQAR